MTRSRRLQRRAAVVGAIVVTLLVATMSGPITGGATESFGSFSVSARSDLFLVEAYESRAPLIPPGQPTVELSPATAHAAIDSLGTSAAFSSAPYPGETVTGLPGLITGLGGGDTPPLPAYPLYVSTRHPTEPQSEVDQGVYELSARSSSTASSGRATFGGGDGDAFGAITGQATSDVEASAEEVRAEATAGLTGLVIPGVIDVGAIESHASVVIRPDAEPETDTSFSVGVLSIGGLDLRIGPDGISLAGGLIPLDLGVLDGLLKSLGVGLEFIPSEMGSSEDGSAFARSAGLKIETTQVGPDGQSTRVVVEIGRTYASADARPARHIGPGPTLDFEPPPEPVPAPPVEPAAPAPSAPAPAPPSAPPEVAAPAPTPVATSSGPFDPGPTLTVIYLALVIGALVSATSGRLLGLVGVRMRFGGGGPGS